MSAVWIGFALWAAAGPGALEPGVTCKPQTPIRVFERPGPGGSRVMPRGTRYTVEALEGDYARVRYGRGTGYLKATAAQKFCDRLAPAPQPQRATPAPPPDEGHTGPGAPESAADAVAQGGDEDRVARPPESAAEAPAAGGPFETDRTKVVVMKLVADGDLPVERVESLEAVIPRVLEGLGVFEAVSFQEVASLLRYRAARQQLGSCDDPSCLMEVGDALGADLLVAGSVSRAGEATIIQLQLIDPRTGRAQGREQRTHQGTEESLFAEMEGAVRVLVRDVLAQRAGFLAIDAGEEGVTVRLGREIVGVTPLGAVRVPGGTHTVSLEKEGFITFRKDVTVPEGEVVTVQTLLIPSPEYVEEYRRKAVLVRTLSWVAIGAGAAAVVGAGALFAAAEGEAQSLNAAVEQYNAGIDRPTVTYDELGARQRTVALLDGLSLAAAGVGVGAIATGVLLRVLGDDPGRYDAVTRTVTARRDPAPPPGSTRILVGLGLIGLHLTY